MYSIYLRDKRVKRIDCIIILIDVVLMLDGVELQDQFLGLGMHGIRIYFLNVLIVDYRCAEVGIYRGRDEFGFYLRVSMSLVCEI